MNDNFKKSKRFLDFMGNVYCEVEAYDGESKEFLINIIDNIIDNNFDINIFDANEIIDILLEENFIYYDKENNFHLCNNCDD